MPCKKCMLYSFHGFFESVINRTLYYISNVPLQVGIIWQSNNGTNAYNEKYVDVKRDIISTDIWNISILPYLYPIVKYRNKLTNYIKYTS